MLLQIHQGVMKSWNILKKFLKGDEIFKYSNLWNLLSSKPQIKKRDKSNEEAPVASTSQPPQEGKKNKKNNWREPYSPSYRLPIIQKYVMDNFFNMERALMEFKDKEEQRMRQHRFSKEITLSPDVVNTLTEIKNGILPLKYIKNSPLSVKEMKSSILSSMQVVIQNKKERENIKFMVENNKLKVLIDKNQDLIQGQQ
ncbi:hypothetical protein O181_075486 [Austropuccinia psidii MF-1]|uniref:Uncharacterized protein n=1 Tax=Austropuccinia psidii MF-1 TaxID=1389203 RepID=A0A9Q3F8M2_9BASI|nr:hypothetical protein [Austropuccinia psidii MF-1]